MTMVLSIQLLRRFPGNFLRRYTTIPETKQFTEEPIQSFRTIENNPVNHDRKHVNRFYTLPQDVVNTIFQYGGLPKQFTTQTTTFLESSILIREPSIDVITCLKLTDYSRPVNRYILYGDVGAGKSLSLAHILHYGFNSKKILLHVPWVRDWYRKPKEVAASVTKEGFYDLPVDAAAWLVHFKHQNLSLLTECDIRLSKNYEWSVREHTPSGTPFLDLIDLGIARIKFACDIINVVIEELKTASIAGKCKVLVVIDGYNALFGDDSHIKVENQKVVYPNKVTLTKTFIDAVRSDWCNGAVVLSVDQLACQTKKGQESHLPRYLLGKEGFEVVDPFLPIQVEGYSADEFATVMEYYKNRKWVRDITPNGQRELELLSARNPYKLMKYTASL